MKFRLKPANRRGGGVSDGIARGGHGGLRSSIASLSWLSSLFITAALLPLASSLTPKEVLKSIHNDLSGVSWDEPWEVENDHDHPCDGMAKYPGIVCDGRKITEINLPNNNLAGTISPHIYTLENLKSVDFSKNRITNAGWDRIGEVAPGTVPSKIEVMDLTNNLINTLEGVTKLKDILTELHMTYNNLRGPMPSELFELKNLEVLAISENEITGEIDPRIGTLTNLRELYCYGNKVTGTIPKDVGYLTKMQIMTFAENQLTGPLPMGTIRNMGNLRTFSVHNNEPGSGSHTGKLPAFDRHPYLNELYLDGNAFTGDIPPALLHMYNGTSTETVTIGLENNELTGTIPVTFLKFKSLVLNVVGNKITAFDDRICGSGHTKAWMNGLVEQFGCDAVLCPVGFWGVTGRQEEEDTPCEICDDATEFMGATSCASAVSKTPVDEEQLEILAEFYLALEGTQWKYTGGWEAFAQIEAPEDITLPSYQEEDINACNFFGVHCEEGKLTKIILPDNGLEGMVPASFWDLSTLEELDLSGNEVRLDRDFGFGDMGNAVNLKKVDLSSNDIQRWDGLERAQSLEELTVDDAYFFSEIDTRIYQLKNLKIWHMQFSGLLGQIPAGIGGLTNLIAINLYGNELSGPIPAEIGQLTKLWHVDFSENDMTGDLPADAIKNLVDLEKFHIHQTTRGGKGITGKLPSFAEQTKLHMLDLNSNTMTGEIPSDFLSGVTNKTQLMLIDISYNEFEGTIPASLADFTNMHFDAVKNKITGVDPALCILPGWWSGEVGKVIDKGGADNGCDAILCRKGTYNDYGRSRGSNNGECKACANGQFAGATTCDGITVESDNMEKKILDKLYVESGGSQWTKGKDTWMNGPVCSYEGVVCAIEGANEGVEEINLAGFGLIGNVTADIFQLPSLKKVDFSQNVVELSFRDIGKAANLEIILMDDADLKTVDGISGAISLKKLHIARNSFPDGEIPYELYSVSTLTSLAISYNGFDGTISPDIANLSALKELWSGSNDLTGSIPPEIGQLSQLDSLVLNANRLSGTIPSELDNIAPLRQLHLQNQRDFGGFSGPVPSFQNSQHIHDVDISGNSLTGSIPSTFMETVRGSELHSDYGYPKILLAQNQITGTIPQQFDDFVGLFINLAGNRITGVPEDLCDDDDEFMGGLVGELTTDKCNAILCPPGTSSPIGRQEDVESPCKECSGNTDAERKQHAPYYGMLKCNPISEERKILEEIHGLIFTGASEDTYWMSDNPICSWYGITCANDADDEGVTEIKLESNSLSTDDPQRVTELFFSLPDLESLNIRGNTDLPLKLDNVKFPARLQLLQLSDTGLTTIKGIGNATALKELHFTENDIGGKFPEEIFNLKSMEFLYMSFNKITGTLPSEIGELTDLREFYAYTNEMTGTLPTELGNLVGIENLVLGKNNFNGQLPSQLNNLVELKEFSVYYNKDLTGPVLDFSGVKKIQKFDLEGNQFTGQLPSKFFGGLDFDYISNPENEIILHLADNALTGLLPAELVSIKNLYLDIVGNKFEEVPPSFCQQSQWMNGKVGELNSCSAIACPKNTFSDSGRLNSNDDESCTPCEDLEEAPFVGSYACSKIELEILALKELYSATGGDSWSVKDNWMDYTKPICSWYGVTCTGGNIDNSSITEINLPDNNLDGMMTPLLFELQDLTTLNLKENSINMKFDNIGKAKKLETLYISDIDIGSIDGIGKAPALSELHLTANQLTGELPADFFDLADTMEYLYIAYNSFSGKLSPEFGRMKNLKDFYAYDNEFTGTLPIELASISSLQNLVLAENKLSGTISEEFSYMPQLQLFSVYRRLKGGAKLSGPLPSFSNAPKLQALYLDYNNLDGTIPSNFLQSSLNPKLRVTISHNSLKGKVPTELLSLDSLNIEMEGNKITDFDERFCEKRSWMNGLVGDYGCDAFMCSPGFYGKYGRQNDTDVPCSRCDISADPSPYWGSVTCDSVVEEREILEILYEKTEGDNWHNNENWLIAEDICTWYGVECRDGSTVQALRLGANNLVNSPPEEIFRLPQLHTIWLHSNPIDFKFKGIGEAKNLVELRLDATGLSDVFGIGDAVSLMKLDLKYNQIGGGFPLELLKLEKLEYLSLTDNRLTGGLPDFGRLPNLISLKLGSNLFSGQPNGFGELKYLLHLDLSENNLVGSIPVSFLSAISERKPVEVDLSSNMLSGGLPLSLDRLDQLVIYLRDNKFTELSPTLCDSNNQGWNLRTVQMFGCNAIMCPPGTANYHGRQSGENTPCLECPSNRDHYGQITCDGMPLEVSSSARLMRGVAGTIISGILFGVLMF